MLKQKRWQSLIHQYCELRAEMSKYDPSRVSGLMRKSLGAKEREFWAARANSEIKQHESSLWAPSPAKGKQKLAPLRLFPPIYSFLKILNLMPISPGLYTFQFDCGDLLGQLLDQSRGCSCEGESRKNSTLVELGLLSPISIQDK